MKKIDKEPDGRPRRIVFTRPLVEKILKGSASVTYRKVQLSGYYYLSTNRFRKTDDAPVIHVYRTEEVEPSSLTDEDAKLAGVDSIVELRRLLKSWYGDPLPRLYRNWFHLVKSLR